MDVPVQLSRGGRNGNRGQYAKVAAIRTKEWFTSVMGQLSPAGITRIFPPPPISA
ncbi:hypothetical protein V1289_006770 [Bradyrhizobium sp. AZCC 2289]